MIFIRPAYVSPIVRRGHYVVRVGFDPSVDPFFDLILLPILLLAVIVAVVG